MDTNEFFSRYGNQLNKQQLEAVESVEGPILLLAVPGSGKTTVLVTRTGYMILCKKIPADNILVLTYTIAATKDMGQRFASIFGDDLAREVEFRTINGICAKIIQVFGRKIGKEPFNLLTDEKEINKIVSSILEKLLPEYPTESDVRVVKTWITYCKNMMLAEDEIQDIGEREEIPLLEVFKQYNLYLKSNRLMDYDDQMVYAYEMLRRDSDLLDFYRKQFKYICIDEAQDTSKIQHKIIALLAGVNGNLFMVGDEDQSIYGFRAAYPEALLDFEKTHSKAKVLVMNHNYRSNAKIVDLADRFIQRNIYRHKKTMQAVRSEGSDIRYVELKSRSNQYNYLLKVAQDCRQETAVLYRLNESCLPLLDLLDRNRIPFRIKGLEMTFFTHRVVQDVINIMRFAGDPYNTELFMNVYYKFQTYLRKNQAENMCLISKSKNIPVLEAARYANVSGMVVGKCNSARTHLSNMLRETPDKAIYRIVNYMGYGDYMERNGMDQNKIFILTNLAYREKTLDSFEKRMGYLYTMLKNMQTNYYAKFILSTIHSSKGLEYDEVYLMDVCDGVFPQNESLISEPESKREEKEGEEERRLFYVGMTRARDRLNIFTFISEESVFLEELRNPTAIRRNKNIKNEPANDRLKTVLKNGKPKAVTPAKPYATCSEAKVNPLAGNTIVREPKCGDRVVQISYGNGQIIEVGLNKNGTVKDFTVAFDSGEEKDFIYPIAFTRGMKYVDAKEIEEDIFEVASETKVVKVPVIQEVVPEDKPKPVADNKVEQARILFEKLRNVRTCLASLEHIPPYCVFPDKVLERMAEVQPTTRWEMLQINGVGERKLSKYGDSFLSEIREFRGIKMEENDSILKKELKTESSIKAKTSNGKRKAEFRMTREEASYFSYQDMLSIVEIRDELNRITERSNVKKISAAVIWKFLVSLGYVEERNIKGQFVNIQTELGAQRGIKDVDTVSVKGYPYKILKYPKNVQVEIVQFFSEDNPVVVPKTNNDLKNGGPFEEGSLKGEDNRTRKTAKSKRETYTIDGETYYLISGRWVDSHYTTVRKEQLYKLNEMRINNLNFDDTDDSELIRLAQEMKDSSDYIYSKKLFEAIFERSSDRQVIRSILSRYTSILRKLEQPREAIETAEKYISIYGKSIGSSALYTSLAGAYCDIGDYVEARKKANIAMAMSGGNAGPELQSVYARIKSMEK